MKQKKQLFCRTERPCKQGLFTDCLGYLASEIGAAVKETMVGMTMNVESKQQ